MCGGGALRAETSGPPDEWIDKDTGHKVIRLSRREGNNSVFYFHQNAFTARGDKMVFVGSTPSGHRAFTVDLRSLEIRQIGSERSGDHDVVAPKRRELFYLSGDRVVATHLDTGRTRTIADVPPHYKYGRGLSINADETLLAGCYAKGEEEYYRKYPYKVWAKTLHKANLPNALYTVDIETGRVNEFHKQTTWFGHVQFSPTDPTLIMFCHEGPERELDRIWLIRTDGTGLRSIHPRTVQDDFVTHEFWHPDGASIWFDLQLPRPPGEGAVEGALAWARGPHYYLANFDLRTGKETRYPLKALEYCWHYNVSPDGGMLCGDGEGRDPWRGDVGKWIYLFVREGERLRTERLCNLNRHDYHVAPNTRFTPDGQWVVFQANLHGSVQVYAVGVRRHGS